MIVRMAVTNNTARYVVFPCNLLTYGFPHAWNKYGCKYSHVLFLYVSGHVLAQ